MTKIHEYAPAVLANVLESSVTDVSTLTQTDRQTLRQQCEADLHRFLADGRDIKGRNKKHDSYDE